MGARVVGSSRGIDVLALVAVTTALLAAPACAQFGGILHPAPIRANVVEGEVRGVDVRNGRIDVREPQGGSFTLRYDRETRVFYDGREYAAADLERGDVVRVWYSQDRSGTVWADRVEVRPGRSAARIERLEGVVGRVELGRGYFTVVVGRGAPVVVYMTPAIRREDSRRLERLRSGERVRLDVRPVDRSTAELVRFR